LSFNASSNLIFKNIDASTQYPDISQLESEKFVLKVNNNTYDLYYGYGGSLDDIGSDYVLPTLSSISLNEERKSLDILMKTVPEESTFWIRVPETVLFADKENFTVLADNVDIDYDLMKFPNDYVIGLFIPKDTKNIEIIGTQVIPEFDSSIMLIFGISIVGFYFIQNQYFEKLGSR
jgi:hypothetical protein